MNSYNDIHAPHYRQNSVSHAPKIDPKDIKSSRSEFKNSFSSHPYGEPSLHVKDGCAFLKSSNRLERFALSDIAEYGFPAGGWEESGSRFKSWKSTGEDAMAINEIPKMPDFTYITGVTPIGIYLPDKRDTKVNLRVTPRIAEAIDFNKTGLYDSKKSGNLYSSLRKLINPESSHHEEAAEWIPFLASKGFSSEKTQKPGILGLGIDSTGDIVAGYYPKKGYLVAADNIREYARSFAENYGFTDKEAVDAFERQFMLHEIAHVLGVGGDRKSEKLQGLLQEEFYTMMADKHKGTRKEKIYRAIANSGSDYAESFSVLNSALVQLLGKEKKIYDLERRLIAKFEQEGKVYGLKEKMLEEYVKSRAKDTYGMLEDDPEMQHDENISELNTLASKARSIDDVVANENARIAPSRASSPAKKEYKNNNGNGKVVYGKFGKSKVYNNSSRNADGNDNAAESHGEAETSRTAELAESQPSKSTGETEQPSEGEAPESSVKEAA